MCATKPATGSPTAPRPPYGLARKEFRLSSGRHVDRGLIAQVGLAVMLGTGCQAAAMAEVVSRQYLRAEALDSITVKLVEFLPDAGASWCARYTVTYGSRVEEGMFPPRLTLAYDGIGAGAEACDLVIRGPRPDQP